MIPPILLYPNLAKRGILVTATDPYVRHIRIMRIAAQAAHKHAGARGLQGTICAAIPNPQAQPGPTPWQTWAWGATALPMGDLWQWTGDDAWHTANAFWRWNAIALFMHEGQNNAFAGNRLDRIAFAADPKALTPVESIVRFMLSCLTKFALGCEDILTTDMTADEPPLPTEVVRGMWEHCEGGLYFVEGTALKAGSNDETDRLVFMREPFGTFGLRWMPIAEFTKPVTTPAGTVPRFVLKQRCSS